MATVLVVDDDPAIVRFINLVLSSEDLGVRRAYSGQEALTILENGESPPDLILLDLTMPEMDGREFYQRARDRGYGGPVIICSAFGASAASQELGAEGAIAKPFDPVNLVDAVREHIV